MVFYHTPLGRLDVISTLRKLKDNDDFNNVTMAHEDVTQVRHTRSSSHHPVTN